MLLWLSGEKTLVIIEETSLVVILDRNGDRYEWPCERVSETLLRGKIQDVRLVESKGSKSSDFYVKEFPRGVVKVAMDFLRKDSISIEVEDSEDFQP